MGVGVRVGQRPRNSRIAFRSVSVIGKRLVGLPSGEDLRPQLGSRRAAREQALWDFSSTAFAAVELAGEQLEGSEMAVVAVPVPSVFEAPIVLDTVADLVAFVERVREGGAA